MEGPGPSCFRADVRSYRFVSVERTDRESAQAQPRSRGEQQDEKQDGDTVNSAPSGLVRGFAHGVADPLSSASTSAFRAPSCVARW